MLDKLRKLKHTLGVWSWQVLRDLDVEKLESSLSPVDKYVVYSGLTNKDGLFHPSYEGWRVRRFTKMMEIYGLDFFKGRKILEVGCGHGDVGAFFAELGADVLSLDGRVRNVNFARLKHRKLSGIRFEHFNLENDFSRYGRFDLIIHFGLLYHLKNVDAHLKCVFSMADDVIMETVVCDSTDPHKILFIPGRQEVDEESVDGTASRPSPFYVERIAQENGFAFTRYIDADLNAGPQFSYDWKHRNDDNPSLDFRLRRLWRFQKKAA